MEGERVQKKKILFIIVFNDKISFKNSNLPFSEDGMVFNFRKIINFGIYTTIYS